MLELSLINERPTLTPMETNQENLEVMITMLMILSQVDQEAEGFARETFTLASAALHNPAEA
jgi:hypothetical protein